MVRGVVVIPAARKPWISWLLGVAVVLSVAIRLYNIEMPILERHGFRQTQTAITSWAFLSDGYDLTDYQTPVLGPPWQVPMEYPVFQACAALVSQVFVPNLDIACRLTNIIFFYVSAWFLFLISRTVSENSPLSWCVLIFYLYSPFTVVWSRASIIDYAAVAFSLAYTYFLITWMNAKSEHQYTWLTALIFGALAYLTKATTMVGFVIPIGAFIFLSLWLRRKDHVSGMSLKDIEWISKLACCVFLPALIGFLWIRYGDFVKELSPYTEFLSSKHPDVKTWVYGSIQQRLDVNQWQHIFGRIWQFVAPYGISLAPLIGLIEIRNLPLKTKTLFVTSLPAIGLPIIVFFNLYYRHDYYLVSLTPFIAILVGLGLYRVLRAGLEGRILLLLVAAIVIGGSYSKGAPYAIDTLRADTTTAEAYRLGLRLRELTGENERIVICGHDWNPSVLYYARRKGYMHIRPDMPLPYAMFREKYFSVLVYRSTGRGDTEYLNRVLAGWREHESVGSLGSFHVFRVK